MFKGQNSPNNHNYATLIKFQQCTLNEILFQPHTIFEYNSASAFKGESNSFTVCKYTINSESNYNDFFFSYQTSCTKLSKMKNKKMILTQFPTYETPLTPIKRNNLDLENSSSALISESLLEIIPHGFPTSLHALLLRTRINKREISSEAEAWNAEHKYAAAHGHLPCCRRPRPQHHSLQLNYHSSTTKIFYREIFFQHPLIFFLHPFIFVNLLTYPSSYTNTSPSNSLLIRINLIV